MGMHLNRRNNYILEPKEFMTLFVLSRGLYIHMISQLYRQGWYIKLTEPLLLMTA